MGDEEDLTTANEKFLGRLVKEKVDKISLNFYFNLNFLNQVDFILKVWNRLFHFGQVPIGCKTFLHDARSK